METLFSHAYFPPNLISIYISKAKSPTCFNFPVFSYFYAISKAKSILFNWIDNSNLKLRIFTCVLNQRQ